MATLKPALTITGTSADFGAALSLSVSKSLTVGQPYVGLSKVNILHTGETKLLDKTINTLTTYIYMKNTDSSNYVIFRNEDDGVIGVLNPGEWCFLPVQGERGLEVLANNATCTLEYAYWTKA
tara:strand:- start:1185 stop:1553 length:369 start_codon:yes stop_codon:yes gene_type:complete